MTTAVEQETSQVLLDFIRKKASPGESATVKQSEWAREMDFSEATVRYNLIKLEEQGKVSLKRNRKGRMLSVKVVTPDGQEPSTDVIRRARPHHSVMAIRSETHSANFEQLFIQMAEAAGMVLVPKEDWEALNEAVKRITERVGT